MTLDIPNYRIVEKLGEGAGTRVYRARCMRSGKDYAVKTVKVTKPEDMSLVEMFRTESNVGTNVDHPAIRKVFELRLIRQRLRVRGAMLFMEYVDGVPMSDKDGRPIDEILDLILQIAAGLQAMHTSGFVHADLKPSNILVRPDGRAKLIDFGQSTKIHEPKPRIQGTVDYMAPEQVNRETLDQRTDVFGLGASLHRILTGRPIATEMNRTVNPHTQRLVGKRVSQVNVPTMDDLPNCVARLIVDCCASAPADRPADMSAFITRAQLARTILAKQGTFEDRNDFLDDFEDMDLDDGHPADSVDPDGAFGDA